MTKLNEVVKLRISEEAINIRNKLIGGRIYGIPVDDFMLEHVDFAIVCAYYLGTTDKTIQWTEVRKGDLV
jgi:hypothetical protein